MFKYYAVKGAPNSNCRGAALAQW